MTDAPPRVEVRGMTKRFGDLLALDDVSLALGPGAFHAILGENGAGKSTLVKCVMGYYRPDAGRVLVGGRAAPVASPRDAHRLGFGMVYQHFTLVPSMTAAENLVLGRDDLPAVLDWPAERRRLEAFLAGMPFAVDLDRPAGALAAGEKQRLEILKQLYAGRRVLILDEPTSVLTPDEADQILGLMRAMADAGRLSVVIITHKFREVLGFAREVTVLRGGRRVGGGAVADLGRDDLVRLMIGAPAVPAPVGRAAPPGPAVVLEVEGLTVRNDKDVVAVREAALHVRAGEIVGVAGVSGNGQRELVEALAGQRDPEAGVIRVGGAPYRRTRAEMRTRRVVLLPEEPLRNACVRRMSVGENLALRTFDAPPLARARWFVSRAALRARARALIARWGIRAAGPDAPLETLSGGNVQRTVLARELEAEPRVVIAQNPCAGLDVAATAEVRSRLVRARNGGAGVLLLSEDLDELLELADRILVMFEGHLVHEAPRERADLHLIGRFMGGATQATDSPGGPKQTDFRQSRTFDAHCSAVTYRIQRSFSVARALPPFLAVAASTGSKTQHPQGDEGRIRGSMTALAELAGKSPGIVAVREKVARLLQRHADARRLPPILIQGETGTGKGLLARAIHRAGPRREGPFVDVNCAAIPANLLESEMFGHERGAFTDARQAKPGLLEAAHRGTIFLDEIGLLPLDLQGKLLSVLEERTVRRLGSTRSEPVDVWILAASNEDLAAAVRGRRFREDLYHRLAVLTLALPPLRERGDDIVHLAERLLARACGEYRLPPKTLAPDALAALGAYGWPGNVRELANVLERVALLVETAVVTADVLGLPGVPARGAGPGVELREELGTVERERLSETLRQTGWNLSRAAARLGIPRNTLRYRIDKHGLRPGGTAPAPRPARARAAPAAEPAPPPAAGGPGVIRWEPRRLTLLRASFGAPGDAAPTAASRGLGVLVDKARSFGGRIEEMSPTGVVAAFGLEPVEDAPRRAAHAAAAIQKAAERTQREAGEAWQVSIAIHVGQFLVGQEAGTVEIDLESKHEAWTTLATLVAAAEPGAIVVSEAAAPFLERRFALVPLEGGPARAFRLAGGERAAGRRLADFVGRSTELQTLHDQLELVRQGRARVVGIVGDAGIGKSRLVHEFRQSLRGQPVTYREGRCLSYGGAVPYLPILDILRQNFRVTEADTAESITEKVSATLGGAGLEPAQWAPYFLRLLGVVKGTEALAGFSPEAIKLRTFEALRQLGLGASRERPLIHVVEDLHWADKTSEECIAWLVESLAGAPIMLVATYRPGYQPPWMDKSYATQLALPPLGLDDARRVVRAVLATEHVPETLVTLILEKAEGNPFFLEELARTVLEQGPRPPALKVPDTVEEVLLARLNRLAPEPKELLQTASVLGRQVSLRLLGAVWDGTPAVEPHLRELMRLEFLHERPRAGEPVLVFKHSLTQDVAYASLLTARRQALHARAGRALEVLYADRLEEAHDRLAFHYSRAGDAPKAVEFLARVAALAARGHAHTEAVDALREALGHADRLPEEARDRARLGLVLRLASSLIPLGRFHQVLDVLRAEQTRVERLDDAALAGHYHLLLGRTHSFLGAHARAAAAAERAIAEAGRCGDEATMGKAYCLLATDGPFTGQALRGLEHGRRAVELLERTNERWWLGHAHWAVALNHGQIGEFAPALEAQARARAIGEAIGDPRLVTFAAWLAGAVHAAMGEGEAGIAACRQAVALAPDPLSAAITEGWLGFAHLQAGAAAAAIPLLQRSLGALDRFAYRPFQGWFTAFLAEALRLDGEAGAAQHAAERALEITRAADFVTGVGWAEQILGRLAQARGELGEAQRRFEAARASFATIKSRYELARARLDLASLARARGEREAMAAHLEEAHRDFRALAVARYVERTAQLAAEWQVTLAS